MIKVRIPKVGEYYWVKIINYALVEKKLLAKVVNINNDFGEDPLYNVLTLDLADGSIKSVRGIVASQFISPAKEQDINDIKNKCRRHINSF